MLILKTIIRIVVGVIGILALGVEILDCRKGKKRGKQEIFVIIVLILIEIIVIQG